MNGCEPGASERKLNWTHLESAKTVQTRISAGMRHKQPQIAAQQEDLTVTVYCALCDSWRTFVDVHRHVCISVPGENKAGVKTALGWTKSLFDDLDQETPTKQQTWIQPVVAMDWCKIKGAVMETKIRSCSGSSCSLRHQIFKPSALTHTVVLLLCGSLVYLLPLSALGRE